MEPRAEPGIFLGYSGKMKGYKVSCDPQWKSCLIRAPRNCIFKEDEFPATTKRNDDRSQSERSATNRDGGIRPDPAPIIVDLKYRSRNCHDQPGSSQGKLVWNEIPRPNTPPLVLDDQYYSSNFKQSVMTQPRYGLRSGQNHHAEETTGSNLVVEINAVLDKETAEFNGSHEETNALDDIAKEYVDSPTLEIGVPKNISKAMQMPKGMEAAKCEINMIQKFRMWKLVPKSEVPAGSPIYTLIWRFTRKADRWMKARLCFPGHCQWKGIDYMSVSSPTVVMASFRMFLTFCKLRKTIPIHIDI
jgi:hypothetical protein